MNEEKFSIILIGPPGSGKSSIVNKLKDKNNFEAVQSGELLRSEVSKSTDLSKTINSYLEAGRLVPDELVKELIINKLKKIDSSDILFDGYPRIKGQINSFFELSESFNIDLGLVIILTLPNELIFKRLTGRRLCPEDGKIFNIYFNPPKKEGICDLCRSLLIHRDDDKPEVVEERIKEYEKNTMPVADFFNENYSNLTFEIKGDRELEIIVTEVQSLIQKNK